MSVSKTQIDRLGERLKGGSHTESDLQSLDDYRRSFGEAYEAVVKTIRQNGELPTGRLAKSTLSIVEKLRRESIRLSQMQDIAGCRIVVKNIVEQDQFVESLKVLFPGASVIDRRDSPSYGYRAVHVIVEMFGKPVEIQVRSSLQHLWAELSEKSSDVLDPTIKYGGGPEEWRNILTLCSKAVSGYERLEKVHFEWVASTEALLTNQRDCKELLVKLLMHPLTTDPELHKTQQKLEDTTREMELLRQEREESGENLVRHWNAVAGMLRKMMLMLDARERKKQ